MSEIRPFQVLRSRYQLCFVTDNFVLLFFVHYTSDSWHWDSKSFVLWCYNGGNQRERALVWACQLLLITVLWLAVNPRYSLPPALLSTHKEDKLLPQFFFKKHIVGHIPIHWAKDGIMWRVKLVSKHPPQQGRALADVRNRKCTAVSGIQKFLVTLHLLGLNLLQPKGQWIRSQDFAVMDPGFTASVEP